MILCWINQILYSIWWWGKSLARTVQVTKPLSHLINAIILQSSSCITPCSEGAQPPKGQDGERARTQTLDLRSFSSFTRPHITTETQPWQPPPASSPTLPFPLKAQSWLGFGTPNDLTSLALSKFCHTLLAIFSNKNSTLIIWHGGNFTSHHANCRSELLNSDLQEIRFEKEWNEMLPESSF